MAVEAKEINLNDIMIENNTRQTFDEKKIKELAASIKIHGVLQPIAVKPLENGKYSLIAGERRLRASFLAGKVTIPAVIRDVNEIEQLEENLIENMQRENVPYMETALGIRALRDSADYTGEEIARKLGKSNGLVWKYLALTKVPEEVQEIFLAEEINAEVAAIIAQKLEKPEHQIQAANALRRTAKDKRVQRRAAEVYLAETFGVETAVNRNVRKASTRKSEYIANWKKYLVRFSPDQFVVWKKWVAGRTETEVLAEAVESVMLEILIRPKL